MSHRRFVALLASFTLALAGCGGGDDGAAADAPPATTARGPIVIAKGASFSPSRVEIAAGQTVTWRFDDRAVGHDVAGDGFKSEVKRSGTFEHTFRTPGTFAYRCTLHPTMKGSVIVS